MKIPTAQQHTMERYAIILWGLNLKKCIAQKNPILRIRVNQNKIFRKFNLISLLI